MATAPDAHSARPIDARKHEHIEALAHDAGIERKGGFFDAIGLNHRALPGLDFGEVATDAALFGKPLAFPFIISSMTGGGGTDIADINRHLAMAAERHRVAMAVGSQRVMLENTRARESFALRRYAPSVPLIANIGAVQLNYGVGMENILAMIEVLEADALYLHLNPLQECIQPEGNTNFARLTEKIAMLCAAAPCPIIIKEVGCGLSKADIAELYDAGVRYLDVAGRGGTSWSRIEHHRRAKRNAHDDLGLTFQDWGLDTPSVIRMAAAYPDLTVIASGGIRNGLDMAKAHVLGAHYTASAAPILKALQEGELDDTLAQYKQELATAMFLLGAATLPDLIGNPAHLADNTSNTPL